MSFIDLALKARERQDATTPKAPTPLTGASDVASRRFDLGEYAREGAASIPPQPTPPQPVEIPEPAIPVSASRGLGEVRVEKPLTPESAARLVTHNAGGVSIEQYRRLAAVLHDLQLSQGLKTLMLTSALPDEGKTLTIANLALTLADSYARRVLVIDADLRRPSLHKLFRVGNETGLGEVLNQQVATPPFQQILPRLTLLTAGRPGRAPLAGLTSERMKRLLDECAATFDWVLLDTPPVGLLPDAQVLARLTGAVVLVVAAGNTPSAAVERAVAEMGQESIIGVVLNRVDERRIPQADYYYNDYSRGEDGQGAAEE